MTVDSNPYICPECGREDVTVRVWIAWVNGRKVSDRMCAGCWRDMIARLDTKNGGTS